MKINMKMGKILNYDRFVKALGIISSCNKTVIDYAYPSVE
jgi:hypothetical protein